MRLPCLFLHKKLVRVGRRTVTHITLLYREERLLKTLLVYSSRTGNTRKVAEAILEIMPPETQIFPIEEAPSTDGYDFIALGYWVDRGGPDKIAKEYMSKIKGTKIGLFGTLGAYPDSDHATKAMANAEALVEQDNVVLGHCICMGKVDPALTERFKSLPADHPHAMTPERIARHIEAAKHPNDEDLAKAQSVFSPIINDLVD